MQDQIRQFIFENFIFEDDSEALLANDDSFLEKGVIDSTGVLELVMWMEDTFGVRIEDTELTSVVFDTVEQLVELISRRRAGEAG